MKNKRKALLLAMCAALLVAVSIIGTIAYLTDTDTVTNTFTVGQVGLSLDEADVDDSDNDGNTTERDQANTYKLLPGHLYDKDPIVHVTATSEDCYLFVIVKNEIAAIESKVEADTVAAQITANGWAKVGDTADGALYVYGTAAAPTAVKGGDNKTVFTTFKIDGGVTNETLVTYAGKTIVVTAYAVQKDGFESSNASTIWSTAIGTPALTA